MKFISRHTLKNALQTLFPTKELSSAQEILLSPTVETLKFEPYPIEATTLEEDARANADMWLQHPNILSPWVREWALSAPDELLALWRGICAARARCYFVDTAGSLYWQSVEAPEFERWEKFEAELARGFLTRPGNLNRLASVEKLHSNQTVTELCYQDTNGRTYAIPTVLQDAFSSAVVVPLPSSGARSPAVSTGGPVVA